MEIIASVIASTLESNLIDDENIKESRKQNNLEIIKNLLNQHKLYPSLLKEN